MTGYLRDDQFAKMHVVTVVIGWMAKEMEQEWIAVARDCPHLRGRCANIRDGGDGSVKDDRPTFLYVVTYE